jgi:hypothetical protein
MLLNYLAFRFGIIQKLSLAQGQEVEFHEIEIQIFQEVELSIMRLKLLIIDSIS